MNRRIRVCLGETTIPVGTLLYETSGNRESCAFTYHDTWLASFERFSLSPDLPLQAGMQFHAKTRDASVFFDCFADTEPDGWGKFPSIADERAVTKGEVLALRLATVCGINAAQGRVEYVDDTPIALIRRFDREASRRIPYVSARTLLGALPAEEHSYTEIVEVIRATSPRAKQDMAELWRRMVFNILITNVDDHLNNHGFLHTGRGQWILSPAFDLNPFPDKQRELKTWISEDSGPSGSIKDCLAVAAYFGLDRTAALAILRKVADGVNTWRLEAGKAGMFKPEADKFAAAFEHAELEYALRITATR